MLFVAFIFVVDFDVGVCFTVSLDFELTLQNDVHLTFVERNGHNLLGRLPILLLFLLRDLGKCYIFIFVIE